MDRHHARTAGAGTVSRCCAPAGFRKRVRLAPATAEAAAAPAAGPVAAPATAAAGALPRLADVQGPALELFAVQVLDGLLRLARRAHLDEAEAAGPSGVAVRDDGRRGDGSRLREQRLQVGARRVERKIPHEDLLTHRSTHSLPSRAVGILSQLPGVNRGPWERTRRDRDKIPKIGRAHV